MNKEHPTNWLGNKKIEVLFILLPSFVSCFLVIFFTDYFSANQALSNLWWIVLVLGIDVSHVYSTLFRTYFDKNKFNENRDLFVFTPTICLIVGIILYAIQPLLFWRILAYLAVFHFMRQQYGFMRLYSRNEPKNTIHSLLDKIVIYSAVVYPILFWHTQADREFSWFIEGDFLIVYSPTITRMLSYLYFLILGFWLANTAFLLIKKQIWNTPKFLIITGTILSWYIGIVAYNGDLVFTLLNVVSHGIPYIALVWLFAKKEHQLNSSPILSNLGKPIGIIIFIGVILTFAYLEEGLWDSLIWRERLSYFGVFNKLPPIQDTLLLNILVPLLSLPQATHYVLDAFIWKQKKPETH